MEPIKLDLLNKEVRMYTNNGRLISGKFTNIDGLGFIEIKSTHTQEVRWINLRYIESLAAAPKEVNKKQMEEKNVSQG